MKHEEIEGNAFENRRGRLQRSRRCKIKNTTLTTNIEFSNQRKVNT